MTSQLCIKNTIFKTAYLRNYSETITINFSIQKILKLILVKIHVYRFQLFQ